MILISMNTPVSTLHTVCTESRNIACYIINRSRCILTIPYNLNLIRQNVFYNKRSVAIYPVHYCNERNSLNYHFKLCNITIILDLCN